MNMKKIVKDKNYFKNNLDETIDSFYNYIIEYLKEYFQLDEKINCYDKNFFHYFEEIPDKLDVLYKELDEVSILVDKAKETFLGKTIFKENE